MSNEDAQTARLTANEQPKTEITPFGEDDAHFTQLKECLREEMGLVPVERIGAGSFSVVFRAQYKSSPVAVKIIDTRDSNEYVRRFLPREKEILSRVGQHPNVIWAHAIADYAPYVVVVTELYTGGTLLDKVLAMNRIPEEHSKVLFRQLIEALGHLQSLDIIHRDLKCENVFLDANDNVKLGDFGFARVFKKDEVSTTFCGSRAYVAPEVLSATNYTGYATDIWSAGVILFVLVVGLMPYDSRDPRRMMEKQMSHHVNFPSDVPLSSEVRGLIIGCLHPVPSARPTIQEICDSDWLRDVSPVNRNTPIHSRLN